MRMMFHLYIIISILIILSFSFQDTSEAFAQSEERSKEALGKMINEYGSSDDKLCMLNAEELAKYYVWNDSLFLTLMKGKPKIFNRWVENLPYAFQVQYTDTVEASLHQSYYEKLKNLMITNSYKRYNDSIVTEMKKLIYDKLISIEIRIKNIPMKRVTSP